MVDGTNADGAGGHGGSTEESALSISGGFGKLVLGYDDDAADAFGVDEADLLEKELVDSKPLLF